MDDEVKDIVEPKGRAVTLAAYKTMHPDITEEPDDESLYDFANNRHSELEGRHNEMVGANTRLAELVTKDPKLGAVLSMLVGENPKSLPFAVSSVYGKGAFELEGDELNDYEDGHQEYLNAQAKSEAEREQAANNYQESLSRLEKYVAENGLDEEQSGKLRSGIMDLGESFLMGNIPNDVFVLIHKGLNYDRDVQEAADTGFVEGKNNVVEAKMKEKTGSGVIPDLGSGTGSGKVKKIITKKKGSFYDSFKEE